MREKNLNSAEKVGDSHAQIVVAVDGESHVFDTHNMYAQVFDEISKLRGRRESH